MQDEIHFLFSIGRPQVDGDQEEGPVDFAGGGVIEQRVGSE